MKIKSNRKKPPFKNGGLLLIIIITGLKTSDLFKFTLSHRVHAVRDKLEDEVLTYHYTIAKLRHFYLVVVHFADLLSSLSPPDATHRDLPPALQVSY